MVYKFFDKKFASRSTITTFANNQCYLDLATKQLAKELHKPIIKKFKKRTIYFGFKDNIWVLI